MKTKPMEEIQTDSARKTIIAQHKAFGTTISVNGCFGSSNIGQKAGFIAREIVRKIPNAFMRCPIAAFPEIEGPTQVLLHDDYHVVIDGCKARCLAKSYEKLGLKVDLSYALDEHFSCEKKPGPDFDENKMMMITEKIIKDIQSTILNGKEIKEK